MLLTGDLEQEGLAALLAQAPRRVDVLMAPHHGSQRVDLAGLVRWSGAKLVVSSQAAPAVARSKREELAVPCWETWRDGAITIESGTSLEARAYRSGLHRVIVPHQAGGFPD